MTRVGATREAFVHGAAVVCGVRDIAVSDFVIDSREDVSARSATLMTPVGANRNLHESIGRNAGTITIIRALSLPCGDDRACRLQEIAQQHVRRWITPHKVGSGRVVTTYSRRLTYQAATNI
jgi:hypothetical protein